MSNNATLSSVADFLAVVETAEQRLADGETKAHRAKALLLQAEKARDEAAARKAEAERQLAVVETALTKARTLRTLVGDETISQGEALLEQTWASAQAEVTRLQTEAEAAQVEAERLAADPEVLAYLDYHDAQKRAEQEAREQAREDLQAQLAALRPAAAVGRGAASLADLVARAEKAGFPDLAAQARDAAEAACRVAQAQAQAEAALRKRRLIRWAEGRSRQAQPGDFVFVVNEDGENEGKQQAAIHLRSLPARSGRGCASRSSLLWGWKIPRTSTGTSRRAVVSGVGDPETSGASYPTRRIPRHRPDPRPQRRTGAERGAVEKQGGTVKARVVITADGQISVFVNEGTLETGREAIKRFFADLAAQDVAVEWDGKVEQHRHEREPVASRVHAD